MGRRMFSPNVVNQDKFLDMPLSTQVLYFQLGMGADDDGMISPKRVMKMINSNEDDLKILIAKEYLIPFESGVVHIKHWRVNNLVRKDWYRPSQYQLEVKQLMIDKGSVSHLKSPVNELVNEFVNVSNQISNKIEPENTMKREVKNTEPRYKYESEEERRKKLDEQARLLNRDEPKIEPDAPIPTLEGIPQAGGWTAGI